MKHEISIVRPSRLHSSVFVTLVAGSLLSIAPQAHAGTWEAVPASADGMEVSGSVSGTVEQQSNGTTYQKDVMLVSPTLGVIWTHYQGMSPNMATGGYSGIHVKSEGSKRIKYRWKPSFAGELLPKIVLMTVGATAYGGNLGAAPNKGAFATEVAVTGSKGADGQELRYASPAGITGLLNSDPRSRQSWTVPVWIDGATEFWAPSVRLMVKSEVPDGQRSSGSTSNSSSSFYFDHNFISGNVQNIGIKSPNPIGLSLAPCPDPTPQPPLNQYVMNGGGQGLFVIPTIVTYSGSDSSFYGQLVNGLDWTIERAPSTMAPRVSNGSSTSGGTTDLFPQHVPAGTTPSSATPGLAFDNVLPPNNSQFGVNSITHKFQGQALGVSPFALFYQANFYTHPVGAAKWCQSTAIGTEGHLRDDYLVAGSSMIPNWFHYYSQAWAPPCPVAFTTEGVGGDGGASYFDSAHPDHVHVNYDANGTLVRNIYESRFAPALGAMRMTMVGTKTFYGIDAYASSVTHEYGQHDRSQCAASR